MKIVHVTDASAAGTLVAVSRLARAQATDPRFERVTFAYTLRPHETPARADLESMFGPAVELRLITPEEGRRSLVELARYVARSLEDEDTVVHVHCSRAGFLGRLVALRRGRDRIVYSPHGLAFSHGHGKYASLVYRVLEQVGTLAGPRIVAVSESERRTVQRSLRGARVTVLHNTVDLDHLESFRTGPAAELTSRPATIFQVGRLSKAKAPDVFGATTDLLRARFTALGLPTPRLVWIGSGDSAMLGGRDIRVTGWLEGDELLREMSAGDVLLFTTLGEGMPMTILDVQALDRPVVASRVVGVTELVDEGRTGLLGSTPEELAEAVVRMVTDAGARTSVVAQAREVVEHRYAWTRYAEQSLRAYRELGLAPVVSAQP